LAKEPFHTPKNVYRSPNKIYEYLEVNAEKTEYILMSPRQKAGQNHDINLANGYFENVAEFRYLGMKVTNQNFIQEEVKRKLNLGNACYHSVQNLSFYCLMPKNLKIRIYKIVILPVGLYVSVTLKEEQRLRMFQNMMLRRIFGLKRDEVVGSWRNCIMRSFITYSFHQA
jgi:hypothetical protein